MTHHHEGDHCDICCAHGEHHEHSCSHEGSCGHHHHHIHEHHEDFAHQLIEMADQAWMEVLHEKIKEQIKATSGNNLDQLAKLVAESNHERWKHKMALQKDAHAYKDKLASFFNHD